MGWLFWKKGDVVQAVGISPAKGGRVRQAIETAKDTLVSRNVRAFEQQREAILNAEKIAKMINNQVFSMKQFSSQVAEWTLAMKKTLDHVSKQSVLIEELETKFSDYKNTLDEMQRLYSYQVPAGGVPSRQIDFQKGEKSKLLAQAREAISKINAELKSVKEDVDDLRSVAVNLSKSTMPEGSRGAGGLPMLNSLAVGLTQRANELMEAAKNIQSSNKQIVVAYGELTERLSEASEQLKVKIDQSEENLIRTGP